MPTECSQDSFDFGTVEGRVVVGAFDGGRITADAGALLLGQTNKAIGLASRLRNASRTGAIPTPSSIGCRRCSASASSASRSATRISTTTTNCGTRDGVRRSVHHQQRPELTPSRFSHKGPNSSSAISARLSNLVLRHNNLARAAKPEQRINSAQCSLPRPGQTTVAIPHRPDSDATVDEMSI